VANSENYKMVIEIDPGTAFGTGLHETTQLCIRQLRKYINNDTNLLDVGCGSGILSIIGRKLGAKNAFGIDIDKAAITASIENAKVNGVEDNITFIEGNLIDEKEVKDKTGYECYDIVVANILADIIIPLSKVIAPHMKKGGLFITSGIINTKESEVVKAIEDNPELEIKEITYQKDWVSVTAVKTV
jgi:ribosomal protein L11 methyltransferase